MDVLLLGASGRIGQRVTNELLERGHRVTGVSRKGDAAHESEDFVAVAGDATDPDAIADHADGHDAVASTLGPGDDQDVTILAEMAEAVVEGTRRAGVGRLLWTGGAGGLYVDADTRLVDTPDFPDAVEPTARAHVDALEVIQSVDDLEWSYIAPAAIIEPGERTGEYRTAEAELVTDENGDSYISMEDFAIAFVDELENDDAIHTQLGVGY